MTTTEEDEEKEHRKKFEALREHLSVEAHREHLAHKHQPEHGVIKNSNPYTNGLYYMELNYVEQPVPEAKVPFLSLFLDFLGRRIILFPHKVSSSV